MNLGRVRTHYIYIIALQPPRKESLCLGGDKVVDAECCNSYRFVGDACSRLVTEGDLGTLDLKSNQGISYSTAGVGSMVKTSREFMSKTRCRCVL